MGSEPISSTIIIEPSTINVYDMGWSHRSVSASKEFIVTMDGKVTHHNDRDIPKIDTPPAPLS